MGKLSSLAVEKALLRKELAAQCAGLRPSARALGSQKILAKLLVHSRFLKARILLSYVARASEVETKPFLEEALRRKKKLFVPRFDPAARKISMIEIRGVGDLSRGHYGILEPAFNPERVGNPRDLDLVIVPGVGFDRQGGRLGRGLGLFDRFLEEAKGAYKIGLAFECQMVGKIPLADHDIRMDEIITEL